MHGAQPPGRRRLPPALVALALAACFGPAACTGAGSASPSPALVPVAPPALSPTAAPSAPGPAAAPPPTEGSPVDPILVDSLCDVVGYQDAQEAIGEFISGTADYGAFGAQTDLAQQGTSRCRHETESGAYVEIGQGSAAELEPGAQIDGVTGTPVTGIGDAAIWFAADPAVLAFRQANAHLRIELNLPTAGPDQQLEIATELAHIALESVP